MSKQQKLSGAEYRKRKANRQKTEACGATMTIHQFPMPVTNVANEALNAPAQGAEQPELHIPDLIDPVEVISLSVSQDTVQFEQVGKHDDVHDDYRDSANDNGDSTNADQHLLNVFIDVDFLPEIITDNLRTELVTGGPEWL